MASKNKPISQQRPSFIEEARRAQIVESAIEVLAETGYAGASMERIATRAGISRGLISYHFAGKDELLTQVLQTVFGEAAAFMGPRVESETTARARLCAYIESNLEFMGARPDGIAAVVAIVASGAWMELPAIDVDEVEREGLAPLRDLLRQGQENGEMRDFDVTVMARAVRNVIDGIAPRASDPDVDLGACARELTTMFDLATRAHPGAVA